LPSQVAPCHPRRGGRHHLPRPGPRSPPRITWPAESAPAARRFRRAADRGTVLKGGNMAGSAIKRKPAKKAKAFNFWDRLKEIDMFFQKRDKVHQSMYRLVKRLEKAKIPYAIMGGMAVNAHNYERTTGDIDVLLNAQGFTDFCRLFVP